MRIMQIRIEQMLNNADLCCKVHSLHGWMVGWIQIWGTSSLYYIIYRAVGEGGEEEVPSRGLELNLDYVGQTSAMIG